MDRADFLSCSQQLLFVGEVLFQRRQPRGDYVEPSSLRIETVPGLR